jgi:microcystin-dependent protein
MAEPFIGEIRSFSFSFAPVGWATCDGQSMVIQQNAALYALLGTTYGGNGASFNLPDLRGRTLLHRGPGYPEGITGQAGTETVALTTNSQLPVHTHLLAVNSTAGNTNTPGNNVLAVVADAAKPAYAATKASPAAALAATAIASGGGSAGHNNMQPSLVINYCIALTGYFPSRP